jgi:ubiquinone/menaquinone biosynthesis C-methylase UbiE
MELKPASAPAVATIDSRAMNQNRIEIIRENYDRIASEYARRMFRELEGKPFDREQLSRFCDEVKHQGPVCDLGCGPGHIARFLRDAGADVFGLDLSPQMIAEARHLNPDIEFREGDMLALDVDNNSLAGLAALYAIVNIPQESLPVAFAEMCRVLKPDGLLLLSFHIGEEVIRPEELWGNRVSMEFYKLQPERIQGLLHNAGFAIEDILERDPYAPDVEFQSRRAYVFARKAAGPASDGSGTR